MNEAQIVDKLIEKSQEAFIMGIEIYNKPTIRYRVEGFSFFICNAWELLLKAWLIKQKDESAIYYRDTERTLSLEACIKKVFTNNKDPLRINLERISKLRNQSTHYVTEEYEILYAGLFQSCVQNYSNKLFKFFEIDITQRIALNFLTLSVRLTDTPTTKELTTRYSERIAKHFSNHEATLKKEAEVQNPAYSITLIHQHYITKDASEATSRFRITNNAEEAVQILRQVRDINSTHPYTAKRCIAMVKEILRSKHVGFDFNMHKFQLFVKAYGMKQNPSLCFVNKTGSQPTYTYSQSAVEFISEQILRKPEDVLNHLNSLIEDQKEQKS